MSPIKHYEIIGIVMAVSWILGTTEGKLSLIVNCFSFNKTHFDCMVCVDVCVVVVVVNIFIVRSFRPSHK